MKLHQSGFTIIELMIATAVFTIILLLTTTTVIGISQTYIKGSIESNDQDTATNVLNDISQDIEYNNGSTINTSGLYTTINGTITPDHNSENEYYFCIGNDVYAYSFDTPLNTSSTNTKYNIGLVRYTSDSCPSSMNALPTSLSAMPTGFEELLVQNERVGGLFIQGQAINGAEAYSVMVEIGYATATSDNIISDNGTYKDATTVPPANYVYPYQCLSGLDSSFCAVTNLTTMVVPRIND